MKKIVLFLIISCLGFALSGFSQEVSYDYLVENPNDKDHPLYGEAMVLEKLPQNQYSLKMEIADVDFSCVFKYEMYDETSKVYI